ncbi:MAG: exodeoxyribonuclease V subunit gamma, partial [Alcaligenaceae bacterium]|nr:exodeoxyribonuclease V subunit gamma [Alcaligenaceae bacterium]
DDRYLFLEALLSARERFSVSWVGCSIVDNTEQPPSVLVGQLREHLSAVWHAADGGDVLTQITVRHPLQAFSPQYFHNASPQARLFTFGAEWRSPEAQQNAAAAHQPDTLEPLKRDEPLSFAELKAFLEHPVREFFRQRLQVRYEEGEILADQETFVADGLDNWVLHNTLIQAARKPLQMGSDPWGVCETELARMQRSGALAFGGAGRLQVERARELLRPMLDDYRQQLGAWPQVLDESLELRHECAGTPGVSGWLHGLRGNEQGGLLRMEMQATQLTSGRAQQWRDEKLVGYWVEHLAANSMGLPLTTLVLSPAGTARLEPLEARQAAAWLNVVLQAWVEGMRRPLPIKAEFARPVLTAAPPGGVNPDDASAWQELLTSEKLISQVSACYDASWNQPGRRDALYEARAYPDFDALFADGELVKWALALYGPMFIALRAKEAE